MKDPIQITFTFLLLDPKETVSAFPRYYQFKYVEATGM